MKRKRVLSTTPEDNNEEGPPVKKIKYKAHYTDLANNLMKDIEAPNNIYSDIRSEAAYKNGVIILKRIIKFCLYEVSDVYKLSPLQYEGFINWLSITLPLIYGKVYYNKNKDELNKHLGTLHDKLVYIFVGARRDGKSILQAITTAAIIIHCDASPFFIPIIGPVEDTGCRMIKNIASILDIPLVKEKYDKYYKVKVSYKKLILIRRNENMNKLSNQKVIEAKAPTDNAFRGINSTYDIGDEMFKLEKAFMDSQLWPRYWESIPAYFSTNATDDEVINELLSKDSDLIKVTNKERICNKCKEKIGQYVDLLKIQEDCQKLGHTEPHDNPWIQDDRIKGWSQYSSLKAFAREANIMGYSEDIKIFRSGTVKKLFLQESIDMKFKCFGLGCDPSDCGKSMTGVVIYGIEDIGIYNSTCKYHLLYADQFSTNENMNFENTIYEKIKRFYKIAKESGVKDVYKTKCFCWIESFMHKGKHIQNKFDNDKQLSKLCKVIKANQWVNKKKMFDCSTIAKTRKITEHYCNFLKRLLKTNKLKIHKKFFTGGRNMKEDILFELKTQMIRLKVDKNSKITGKGNNGNMNDDMMVSMMMVPFNMERAMFPQKEIVEFSAKEKDQNVCLNQQLNYDITTTY